MLVQIDSMGNPLPVDVVDRVPGLPSAHGTPPQVTAGRTMFENFAEGVVRPYTTPPLSFTGYPYAGRLPFDPHAPVPGDARGFTRVRWPVPGGSGAL